MPTRSPSRASLWGVALLVAAAFAALAGSVPANVHAETTEAPTFTLNDLEGNPHSLADFRGRIVVLDFWATWCPGCLRLMDQLLKPLYETYRDDDRFALISIGTSNRDTVADQRQVVQRRGYEWLKLHDADGTVFRDYRVRGLPTYAVIDEHGQVVASEVPQEPFQRSLKAYLTARLSEPGELSQTADVTFEASGAAVDDGGWGVDTMQVIVLLAVVLVVVVLMLRDRKKRDAPPGGPGSPGSGASPGGPGAHGAHGVPGVPGVPGGPAAPGGGGGGGASGAGGGAGHAAAAPAAGLGGSPPASDADPSNPFTQAAMPPPADQPGQPGSPPQNGDAEKPRTNFFGGM